MVITYKNGKDILVMVWAAIWWKDGKVYKSELYILERDWESKKHGYTANSNIDVLNDQLPRIWEPGMVFMRDNALIYCANKTKEWFRDMGIPLTDWPPYSLDLNPIKHVWWHLKAKVLELHPELKNLGTSEELNSAERGILLTFLHNQTIVLT
jgi:transposase